MSKFRRAINLSFIILVMGCVAYFIYGFATAEARIKEVCSQIKPGMSISQLRIFGVEHGLTPQPRNESGVNYMVESKTYGRFGCKVVLEAGVVKNSEYNFAD
jgi:hypothetical protein